jgi:hypothetical protein
MIEFTYSTRGRTCSGSHASLNYPPPQSPIRRRCDGSAAVIRSPVRGCYDAGGFAHGQP